MTEKAYPGSLISVFPHRWSPCYVVISNEFVEITRIQLTLCKLQGFEIFKIITSCHELVYLVQ